MLSLDLNILFGVAIPTFPEFIHSEDDKYWLNNSLSKEEIVQLIEHESGNKSSRRSNKIVNHKR
jgi:hypothetical protein